MNCTFLRLAILIPTVALTVGCTKEEIEDAASGGINAAKPSTVLSAIDSKVTSVGSNMQGLSALGVDDHCSVHAEPLVSVGVSMASTADEYPLKYFYCQIMKNTGSPDSVPGSYTLIKNISCALENSGQLVYDGTTHSGVSFSLGLDCFTQTQLDDIGAATLTIDVTASAPASFNTNYDYGVIMVIGSFGTFKFATKVDGNVYSFIAMEDQTAIEADKTGAYGATYDSSTGTLWYEARHDRYACTEAGGSCQWSRHARIYADLDLDGSGNITGVSNFEGVAAEIYDGGGGSYSSKAVSLKGNLTDGLKGRGWTYSGATATSMDSAAALTESGANTKCYDSSGDAGACTANTGIDLSGMGAAIQFFMFPSSGYTTTTSWFTSLTGLDFTSVDFSDSQ